MTLFEMKNVFEQKFPRFFFYNKSTTFKNFTLYAFFKSILPISE